MKRILVVEDERVVARDIQRSLTDLGYQVPATAATSEQALLLADEHSPHLVLMDIRLKGEVDGIETAALLKAKHAVPIVYLTAYADALTVERAKATEPLGYVLKPLRANELRSTVELALYRHEMETQLREREHWLTTTLSSIGDAVISTDNTGLVNYLNPTAETLLGVRLPDFIGRRCQELVTLVDGSSRMPLENPVTTVLRDLKPVHVEGALIRPDGREFLFSDCTSPVVDERGRVLGAVMVFQDVTEQKRLQRQLDCSDRLAATATVASGIAHEINNPLAFFVANLAYVLEEVRLLETGISASTLPPDKDWRESVEAALVEAQQGADRVCKIVADLRVFTLSDPASPANEVPSTQERIDVHEALEWALQMGASELRFVTVVKNFGSVPLLSGDAARLGLAFMNILTNAAESMFSEGHLPRQLTLETRTNKEGDAMIEIRDTGVGMPTNILDRAVEPFFTTKGGGERRGLGLSISHGIVTGMNGTLELQSEPGHGTLARVRLPAGVTPASNAERSLMSGGGRGYVLLVDDEAMIRSVLQRILGKEHVLTCPKTSPEALALIDGGLRFDLILCDLVMPVLSGRDFHAELVRRHPDQARRTAFLTGGATTHEMLEFSRSTPNRYIQKPFDAGRLREVVNALLHDLGRITRPEHAA